MTGLPVVTNRRRGEPVPELRDDLVVLVDDTPAAYAAAWKRLTEDVHYRAELGRRAFAYAREHWAPEKMEARMATIYRSLMGAAAPIQ